jgi:hypothetical protein
MANRVIQLLTVAIIMSLAGPMTVSGQAYINQSEIEEVLEGHKAALEELPDVYYDYYVLSDSRGNSVLARNTFYKQVGDGDMELGMRRAKLVELLNRSLLHELSVGDTLVVPTDFELDFRAYSPFPRYYPGAREFDKLFIIEKSVQAWAAYEYGQLVRWGIVNTGSDEYPTPTGRYNFNWKEEFRVSSLSPPGEPWEMYWVVNFHDARGIHVHQYAMPTGGPTSRGCVRLIDADARWIYDWADGWRTSAGGIGVGSRSGRVLEQGTTVLVLGEDPTGHPMPFDFKRRYPVLNRLELPNHPFDVPPGTPQQEHFDRLRASRR